MEGPLPNDDSCEDVEVTEVGCFIVLEWASNIVELMVLKQTDCEGISLIE